MSYHDAPKCTAHRTDGQPCRGLAIRGANVCRVHGGSAGHVREAAQRRLLEAVDPLMAELLRIALCDDNSRVRLAAIKDALDRAGVAAPRDHRFELTLDVVQAELARKRAELVLVDGDGLD